MSRSQLVLCPTCARHVRVSEAACPFCGFTLSDELRAQLVQRAVKGRYGRAARHALGFGALSLAACSSTGGIDSSGDDASTHDDSSYPAHDAEPDRGTVVAPYGAPPPPPPDAGHDSGHDAGPADAAIDHALGGQAYGAPPPHDAGQH